MKKIFLILGLVILTINIEAQTNKFYVGISGGYGLGVFKNDIVFNNDIVNSQILLGYQMFNSDSSQVSGERISLTEGFNVNFAFGYNINNKFSIEISARYTKSNDFSTERYIVEEYPKPTNYRSTINSESIFIIPQIKYYFDTNKVSPYIKTGLIISSSVVYYNIDADLYLGMYFNEKAKYKFYDGYNLGFYNAIGAEYNLSKHISLFGDISISVINFSHKKLKRTEMVVAGVDENDNERDNGPKEIDLYKSYDVDENYVKSALTQIFPASNIALNIGVQFNF